MSDRKGVGVVLFQLGGPDSPAAVEPFLYNLFCDPDIIDFPGAWLARRPLAWWIAHRRAAIVGEHYEAIGGHSPIAGSPSFSGAGWNSRWLPISTSAASS